jgi:hypothetical protein
MLKPVSIEQAKRVMDIQMIVQKLGFNLSGGKYPLSMTECLKAGDRDKINGAALGSISKVLKKHLIEISVDNRFCSASDLVESILGEIGLKITELKVYQECNGEGIIDQALPLMIAFIIVRDHPDAMNYQPMMTARLAIVEAQKATTKVAKGLGHLEKEAKKRGEHISTKDLKEFLPTMLGDKNLRLTAGEDQDVLIELAQMAAESGNPKAIALLEKIRAPEYTQQLMAGIDFQRALTQAAGNGGNVIEIQALTTKEPSENN